MYPSQTPAARQAYREKNRERIRAAGRKPQARAKARAWRKTKKGRAASQRYEATAKRKAQQRKNFMRPKNIARRYFLRYELSEIMRRNDLDAAGVQAIMRDVRRGVLYVDIAIDNLMHPLDVSALAIAHGVQRGRRKDRGLAGVLCPSPKPEISILKDAEPNRAEMASIARLMECDGQSRELTISSKRRKVIAAVMNRQIAILDETAELPSRVQPFERHPFLAYWINRLAEIPISFSADEWQRFIEVLNAAVKSSASSPPIKTRPAIRHMRRSPKTKCE